MRPKLIALLAVSAFALVGCSVGEPSVEPTATVTQPEQTQVSAEVEQPVDSAEVAEEKFADFAIARADVHSAKIAPSPSDSIDALHEYCDNGTPIKVSKTEALNENLEIVADKAYCEMVETN